MFEAEAATLCEMLLGRDDVSPLLNLGSSTREFRETVKPHIESKLFGPLRAAGVEIFHSDLKAGGGVDLAGDVLDPAISAALCAKRFRCVLLANVLEHVRDRPRVIAACEAIVGPGGLIVATVPSSHPYHADPIDTGFRPSPAELGAQFTRSRMIDSREVCGSSFAEIARQRASSLIGEAARTLLWCLAFPVRPKSARARLDRWRWLRRPYRVSIVLMSVREASES
jgi:hypothetical protein